MKHIITYCLTGIFLTLFAPFVQGQDPVFSQFYASPLNLNPAMAGTEACGRIALNFREQWPGIQDRYFGQTTAYRSYAASYDQYFDGIRGAVGLNFSGDLAGDGVMSTHSVGAVYAYRIKFQQFHVQAAVEASFYQKQLDWDRLVFSDQLNDQGNVTGPTQESVGNESMMNPNFSAGVFAYSNKYYGGVAVRHLTRPDESYTSGFSQPLPRRFTVHGGAVFNLQHVRTGEPPRLNVDVLYTQQTDFKQLNAGLFWTNGMLIAGLWGRVVFGQHNLADAVIPRVGFMRDFFSINYSYDFTISAMREAGQFNTGAHEIALQFFICPKEQTGVIFCPLF